MRIGIGYDIHKLVAGKRLYLGGIRIPFEKGLSGHSDADVLLHALCDSLLGAAALGDIGHHFPDTSPEYKNISSILLLEKTYQMVRDNGLAIVNLDATIFAEAPKMLPFRNAIRQKIAGKIDCEPGRINIKATTTEGLGIIGKGEAIAALCIALLQGANFV